MVSIDRYIAVKHRFLYQQIKHKHVVKSVLFAWFCAFIFHVIMFKLGPIQIIIISIGMVLFTLQIVAIFYCTLYVQIKAHFRACVM